MFVFLKNNPVGVKFLAEKFGGTYLRLTQTYWAWFPPAGAKLELVEVEIDPSFSRRIERWVINGEQFTVERLDTYDEIYQEIGL